MLFGLMTTRLNKRYYRYNPKFETTPMFPIRIRILVGLPPRFLLHVLSKNGFYNKKISEFEDKWGWGNFFHETPKGTSLAEFTHFEPLVVQIRLKKRQQKVTKR